MPNFDQQKNSTDKDPKFNVDVLVVGAGPSGMTMALALQQFGVKTFLIDRQQGILSDPRAHALNSRTLEIFESLGMDIDDFKQYATPSDQSCWVRWVDTLSGEHYGVLPYERMHMEANAPTPHPLFNITQTNTEKVMEQHVRQGEKITFRRGWTWESCEEMETGIESVVTDDEGGKLRIHSRYLIAADGAGSPIRRAHDISLDGLGVIQHFKNIHFQADLSEILGDRTGILYWVLNQKHLGTFIAYDLADEWVYMVPLDAHADAQANGQELDAKWAESLVKSAIGRNDVEINIHDVGDWAMSSDIASRYREGRVFLVGDSAHRYPPSGGLGLNTGVADAQNLAWKIASVLQGWSDESLLDSYQNERKPVAEHNAAFSVDNVGNMLSVMDAAGVLLPPGEQRSAAEIKQCAETFAKVEASIEAQRSHFDGLALHIGVHYGRSSSPDVHGDQFQWVEEGSRFPHAWIETTAGKRSSHHLLSAQDYTLVLTAPCEVDVENLMAIAGASQFKSKLTGQTPLKYSIHGIDFSIDDDGHRELGFDRYHGILVRPDGHIARCLTESELAQIKPTMMEV